MKLTFFGAAQTVTGSRTMVEDQDGHRLLVDCGMFQGTKTLRLRNWAPLPFSPAGVDAVALTHAHVDHSGALPLLVKQGFKGKIICTEPTAELVRILLLDAAHLETEQAAWANKRKSSKHSPALPLFTAADAEAAIAQLAPVPFGSTRVGSFDVEFRPAGHILGAASLLIAAAGRRVFFSGDVGRPNDVLMRPPQAPADADVFVVESTYGGRAHHESDVRKALADIINRTAKRGGVLMVPAFAVGRAQALLFLIAELKAASAIPTDLPVYLNSPMATDVTGLYCDYRALHRLSPEDCGRMCQVAKVIRTTEESKLLNKKHGPMIVIAGSGMATGGRIIHHLAAWGPDNNSTILLVGYQAAGTRGALISQGAKELKMFGEVVPIRAEVARVDAMSGHADEDELLAWLKSARRGPKRVVLNHGEPEASAAMAMRIRRELSWEVDVATDARTLDLNGDEA